MPSGSTTRVEQRQVLVELLRGRRARCARAARELELPAGLEGDALPVAVERDQVAALGDAASSRRRCAERSSSASMPRRPS